MRPVDQVADSRAGLEEEREFLLRSLDDLEHEWAAGELEQADYLALKDDYTARAASVLRAIEASDSRQRGPVGSRPDPVGTRRRWKPVLTAVTVLAFAVGAGLLVARSSGERLPDEPATGDITATGPSTQVARDLARARRLIGDGKTLDAIKVYDEVLDRQPDQVEALAYRGWLVRLAGRQSGSRELMDKGLDYLNRAVAVDPSYPDAHFFRGMMLYQDKADPAGAAAEFRAFLSNNPPRGMVRLVEDVLRRAEADAAGRPLPPPQ
jgi:tetratricopeptide (TPR) repeat protein